MRILLVVGTFLPDKRGGIENYCYALAGALCDRGHTVEVAILDRNVLKRYLFESLSITPLGVDLNLFAQFLQKKPYDICHFQEYHGLRGINVNWIKVAKQYCQKVFFTFHLPYLTCYKNDFRYFGISDCNNFSNANRCVNCIIATKFNYQSGSQYKVKNLAITFFTVIIRRTDKIKKLINRIKKRKNDLDELIDHCDKLFIYGEWFKNILLQNGFDSPKLVLIPHLIKSVPENPPIIDQAVHNKILFVGRIEQQKGLHLLCKAMNKLENKKIELDVAGNIVDKKYFETCKNECSLNYLGAIPHLALMESFKYYDFLILPSVFTEMYSLVIREAFRANLPVIASSAKGNIDVIIEHKNGFIFEYDNFEALAAVIDKAYHKKENGWEPQFEINDSQEDNLWEILSYYS